MSAFGSIPARNNESSSQGIYCISHNTRSRGLQRSFGDVRDGSRQLAICNPLPSPDRTTSRSLVFGSHGHLPLQSRFAIVIRYGVGLLTGSAASYPDKAH